MASFTDPYRPRRVRFLELWETSGWRLKVYGIAPGDGSPEEGLVSAAKAAARGRLPVPAVTDRRYGVGFVGVHQGPSSSLVLVDWWADENELHHLVFVSYAPVLGALTEVTSTSLAACVWDLGLLAFERDAWIATAMAAAGPPDLEGYLASRLDGRV